VWVRVKATVLRVLASLPSFVLLLKHALPHQCWQ
jgi:hypothetical protein